jgi:DNA-binding LacI/PurR family transcriptional regulator
MPTASFDGFQPVRPAARHQQITDFLRDQVISGALAPDARLPTTQELAKRWNVPIATIQAAFAPLVKEGLLLRRPGFGTVVRSQAPALTRVAIYQIAVPDWNGGDRFAFRLADLVESRLAERGLDSQRLVDRRAGDERTEPLAEMVQAARSRHIDAMIATDTDERSTPWLQRLPVPTAIYGSGGSANEPWFDIPDFASQGLARLAARGCRRVGLITVLPARPAQRAFDLHRAFVGGLAAHGLETRPEWLRLPGADEDVSEGEAERFGYRQVHALWAAGERPDGLLVYTDRVARGVVMGLLALGVQTEPPHLVLHRNAELGLFCPLPADYLESSATTMAEGLIAVVEAQHRGRPLPPSLLQFSLVAG